MKLTCGHTAAAPKFTGAQLFAAKTMGEVPTANLMLTCPAGHGLVDVVPAEERSVVQTVPAGYVDPWEVGA